MKKYWGLLLIIVLSLGAIVPLHYPGFFPMHDDTQVSRVFEMAKALGNGQFPVRWVPDLGYGMGYPLFNFYSPLPYYVGAIFNLIGYDALVSTKIMFGIGILLAGIFMYFLTREFWGEWGGRLSAVFFTYAPYHAVQIYVRGSVGEFWALSFIPLLGLGLYKIIKNEKWGIIIGSLGYAGIILSHNLTAMITTLFLVPFYGVIFIRDLRKRSLLTTYYLLLAAILGVGLCAFYWLPALLEMGYTNVSGQIGGAADFKNHFVCLSQLWNSSWGFGGSAPGCVADGLSFKIGKIHLLVGFLGVLGFFFFKKDNKLRTLILLSVFYFLLATFLTLEISKPVWEALPFMAYIQYPWRFLSLIIFFVSFLSGGLFLAVKNNSVAHRIFYLLFIILIWYNAKYFQPQTFLDVTTDYYTNETALKGRISKISDEYLPRRVNGKQISYNFKKNTPVRSLANLISVISIIIFLYGVIYVRKTKN